MFIFVFLKIESNDLVLYFYFLKVEKIQAIVAARQKQSDPEVSVEGPHGS
jgi:hypothetical protein